MKYAAVLFVLALLLPCVVRAAEEAAPETITIAGEEYRVIPDEVFRTMGFEFPKVSPEENAAWDYIRAINAYTPWEVKDRRNDPRDQAMQGDWPEDDAALRNYLAQNKEVLKHLRAGAQKKVCHFPFLESGILGMEEYPIWSMYPLEVVGRARESARFLRVVGSMREHDGDFEGDMDAYLTAVALGVHVCQGKPLLNWLSGTAIFSIGARGMQTCAAEHKLPNVVLHSAQKRLAALRGLRPSHLDVIRFERVFSREVLEYVFRQELPSDAWRDLGSSTINAKLLLIKLPAVQDKMRLANEKSWDELEKVASGPLPEYMHYRAKFGYDPLESLFADPIEAVACRGPIVEFRVLYERENLQWTVTDVFLALARYRAKHGEYPEKLEEAKGLMVSDGIDPFSGKLLKYRREKDGSFTLWSVGEDLKDDGGKVGPETRWVEVWGRRIQTKSRWLSADYVWNSGVIQGTD